VLPGGGRRVREPRWLPVCVGVGLALVALAAAAIVGFLAVGAGSGSLDAGALLTSPQWDPIRGHYGGAAMIWGTAAVGAVGLALAAPLGWGVAVAINELAPRRLRSVLRASSELLAVVPSIVYGLVGIVYVRPLVAQLTGSVGGDSLLAAGLVLAVMVLPTIVAVSIDALAAVPLAAREAAAALGLRRTEVIRAAVLPYARRGMGAAALLGLARALGETVAVFLLVGRADGRLPSLGGVFSALAEPGQTLTTKLNSPESVLAGTSGAHWAALCGLGLVLLLVVASLTAVGLHRSERAPGAAPTLWRRGRAPRGAAPARELRDRATRVGLLVLLAVPPALFAGVAVAAAARGPAVFDPGFWLSPASGASGGGIRDQLLGTLLLVATAGVLAAPVGLSLGLVASEYAPNACARWLRVATVTLAGVPSIVLGLAGYYVFSVTLGWGKSWLAGAILLAVIAIPVVALAVAARVDALPAERREAAEALGLRRGQLVRSVLMPHARPALATGLLLGLARAAGETAPLLFVATVTSGAGPLPGGVTDAPVLALPTHIFNLAQDAVDPAALHAAWGAAAALLAIAGLLLLAAVPARRRMEAPVP